VDRGVRESGAIDLSELTLPDGKVWIIFIDVHVLDHDGNLMDAAALGALAALVHATKPVSDMATGLTLTTDQGISNRGDRGLTSTVRSCWTPR